MGGTIFVGEKKSTRIAGPQFHEMIDDWDRHIRSGRSPMDLKWGDTDGISNGSTDPQRSNTPHKRCIISGDRREDTRHFNFSRQLLHVSPLVLYNHGGVDVLLL